MHFSPEPESPSVAAGVTESVTTEQHIRVLVFVEAKHVTGPAKNIIELGRRARLHKSGATIDIVIFRRGNEPVGNEFVSACMEAGLRVHSIQERFVYDPAVIGQINQLVTSVRPDIVESHAVKSHFLIRLTQNQRSCAWVAFHHGYTWTSLKTRIYNLLDSFSLRAACKVVTVCRPFAGALQRIGVQSDRIVILHNTVNPFSCASEEEISGLRRSLGISEDTQLVLCIGRLSREKGQIDLIKAIALLRDACLRESARFVFIGDGPDRGILENVAKRLSIESSVVFTGQIANMRPFYSTAGLVVLPSYTEGSPNVLLEAMAAGVPVIATSVGGVPEMVTHGKEALVVEKGNPKLLAATIEQLIHNVELKKKLGMAARERSKVFSPDAYCNSILSLYRTCLGVSENSNKS